MNFCLKASTTKTMTLQTSIIGGGSSAVEQTSASSSTLSNPSTTPAPISGMSSSSKLREVEFSVSCTTNPGEVVCVVGNCSQLGNWKHEGALVLQRKAE